MSTLNRHNYRKLSTEQLQNRYRFLIRDTSTETMEEECGRMFAIQEISEVLNERNALPSFR